jgi:hypothetical protein
MKAKSFFCANLNPQRKALQNPEATAWPTALVWLLRFAVMLFALSGCFAAFAQQVNPSGSAFQRRLNVTACGYGLGQCDEATLSPNEVAQVSAMRHRQNVSACGYGLGQCNDGLLTPGEVIQVTGIRHRQNVSACGYGLGQCNEGMLTTSEFAQVSAIRHRQNLSACEYGLGQCNENLLSSVELARVHSARTQRTGLLAAYAIPNLSKTAVLPPAPVVVATLRSSSLLSTLLQATITSAVAPVAENGSYYGQPNQNGVPKTVLVRGYTTSSGNYVQGYYRSAPGTNPVR